jgi:hypothetical protein
MKYKRYLLQINFDLNFSISLSQAIIKKLKGTISFSTTQMQLLEACHWSYRLNPGYRCVADYFLASNIISQLDAASGSCTSNIGTCYVS